MHMHQLLAVPKLACLWRCCVGPATRARVSASVCAITEAAPRILVFLAVAGVVPGAPPRRSIHV